MCLDVITKRYEQPDMTEREGWKVFVKREWEGDCERFFWTSERLELNQWLKAKPKSITTTSDKQSYSTGFHIFLDRAAAKEWMDENGFNHTIRRVRFRATRLEGKQPVPFGTKKWNTVVADELYIPAEANQ